MCSIIASWRPGTLRSGPKPNSRGAVLISKDEDFVHLRTTQADGPALIWVRIGNTTRRELLDGFTQLMPAIETALMKGEQLIEIAAPSAGRFG